MRFWPPPSGRMNDKEIVTIRLPRRIAEAVRQLALRDDETQSAIFRRLLRSGLAAELEEGGQRVG